MLCVTYKWNLEYVDALTWPQIKSLLDAMREYPPADLFLFQMFKGMGKTQPATLKGGDKIPKMTGNIPMKKGKISKIRRGKHGD